MELPGHIQVRVDLLFEQSESCYAKGDYDQCITLHKEAWGLFPEPRSAYEEEGYSLIKGLIDLLLLLQGRKTEAAQWGVVLTQFNCLDIPGHKAAELDDVTYDQIQELSEQGNALAEDEAFSDALEKFNAALMLVPEPKTEWEAATWLYASMGDMYYLQEDYAKAREQLYNALNCPDGQQNGFIHLRLGQALRRLHEQDKALDHLLRAYMIEGKDIFKGEREDFRFLKEHVPGIS